MRIGIAGKMGAGKTTLANYIRDTYGYVVASFATPLKQLEHIHATSRPDQWEVAIHEIAIDIASSCNADILVVMRAILDCFEANAPTPGVKNRKLLQELGTDYMRCRVHPDVWVLYLLDKHANDDNLVVDDVRFPNELQLLMEHGFTSIRLQMPDEIRLARIIKLYGTYSTEALSHPSEVSLDDSLSEFDYIIAAHLPLPLQYRIIDAIVDRRC